MRGDEVQARAGMTRDHARQQREVVLDDALRYRPARDVDDLQARVAQEEQQEEEALLVGLQLGAVDLRPVGRDGRHDHDRLAGLVEPHRAPHRDQALLQAGEALAALVLVELAQPWIGCRGLAHADVRAASRPTHVVDARGAREPAQVDLAHRLGRHELLGGGVHALADQDLARPGLGAQPRGEVRHVADGRVVEPALVSDAPERGVALRHADGEGQVMAPALPLLGQRRDAVAHGDRHLDGALRGVGTRERVVEEGHQAVAGEAVERPLVAVDEIAERGVVLAEHQHQVLGLDGLGERREAAQVAEHDRDLLPVALEERLVARRHDELGDLRRQEAPQPPRALELGDLLLDALLELAVPRGQLGRLRLDRVVVALDAQQRAHPREQLGLLEGLGDEVVGPGLDRGHLLLLAAGGDHHDRQELGGLVGAQRPADLVAVHPGHDDVEQHEVDRL